MDVKAKNLTFAPGETEKTIKVPILDDSIVEGDETFKIVLSNASGAIIADGEGLGTIKDNDLPANNPPVANNDAVTTDEDTALSGNVLNDKRQWY